MVEGKKDWNKDLIEQIYVPKGVDRILNIPLRVKTVSMTLGLGCSRKKGMFFFFVKSYYHIYAS